MAAQCTGVDEVATFYKMSKVWVIDFTYDGHPRRWLKALPANADAAPEIERLLSDLYGSRTRLISVRAATADEETRYIRGDLPQNMYCPTGDRPPDR